MLKKRALKKILISSLALIIVSVLYLFPNSNHNNLLEEEVVINEFEKQNIYMPNEDDYVARTYVITKEKDTINKIKEIINYLTIDSENKDYIPIFFKQIIPKDTKIIDLSLDNDLLKINFSKEFLNIKKQEGRKLIESLIFSLTEFKNIKKIMIFVEGELLKKIPGTHESISPTLDRKMGVNIVYDFDDYKNTSLVTTYYVAKKDNCYYYIPVSKISNNNAEKVEVIIEELKSSPIYGTNLMSFLKSNAKLLDYEILENQVNLSFNNYLLDSITSKKILEEVKYSIALSIKDNYDIDTVSYFVNNEEITKLTIK